MERAARFISNNIAEGFARGTTPETPNFLYYARSSAGEMQSRPCVMTRMKRFAHLKLQIPHSLRSTALKERWGTIPVGIRG